MTPAAIQRICVNCRLVFVEQPPPVPQWAAVCPRCHTVATTGTGTPR